MTACETDAVTFGKMTRALSASQTLVPGTMLLTFGVKKSRFLKIKRWNKVCSSAHTFTKMQSNDTLKLNYTYIVDCY